MPRNMEWLKEEQDATGTKQTEGTNQGSQGILEVTPTLEQLACNTLSETCPCD